MKETAPLWSSLFRYSKYWIVLEVERHQQVRTDIVRSEVETAAYGVLQGCHGLSLCGQIVPAIEQQATDRAYRIGQHRNVTVYHLIAADTIEEKILRLHQTKRDLSDSLLEGTDTSHTLTIDDLKYLVSLQQQM